MRGYTTKASQKQIWQIFPAIIAVAGLLIVHFYGAQLGIIGLALDHSFPGIVSSESYKRAVMHPERDDAYSAYDILGQRGSRVAEKLALRDIHSDDDYLWLNAALYLGQIGNSAAIPYLIKAFRHTAWRSDEKTKSFWSN